MVWRPVDFSLWKSRQCDDFVFAWLCRCDEGQSSNGQKAGSDKAICSMWKIKVSHKEKSMHSLYTSNTHAHFFSFPFFLSMKVFYREDISRALASPPTWRRLKFISLTPDKPAPALSGTGSEVIKDSWRNRSYSRLSKKQNKKTKRYKFKSVQRHNTHAHTNTHTPWVHVDKFFNKLWLKGSWFYSDSPPSFQTVYWK